ncbi:copper chaperone PCu(A)C [Streptomyces sp. NPDC058322]|uniref:copper chaperone PCu(A)C n=1 Tax=unclassified Streptomyces TaxID=2593676 RepID=UPI003410113A
MGPLAAQRAARRGLHRNEELRRQDIKVTKIVSPDYQRITIYQTAIGSENAKMVKVDGVTVPAKGDFSFVPGSYHIMFEKPTHLITPGDNARVIFHLDNGTVFKVRMPVRTSPELH